jgi:hypothetical protein
MLFQPQDKMESEKERNFYSKVFAGYYFNELVPEYETRLQAFINLLNDSKESTFSGTFDKRLQLSPKTAHVTFDFHGYLIEEEGDRGELADILITDFKNRSAVAIEVKFLSDWKFEKDILGAHRRFQSLLHSERISSFAQVLLLTQTKLESVRRAANRPGSNWVKLSSLTKNDLGYPVVVLTWEDIAKNCTGPGAERVTGFINQQLKQTRETFRENARNMLGLQ